MDGTRVGTVGAAGLVVAGIALAVASAISVGEAQSWGVAEAFAADSVRPVRRIGMLLGALGLAVLVAGTPTLMARTAGTPGAGWVTVGWIGFALGATLFAMAIGLAAIVMPALGELAGEGAVSPQAVADGMTRQAPLVAAFLGGNVMYLAWIPIGIGLARSGQVPAWLGWTLVGTAVAAWLSFLHVPVFERFAGPLWPLTVAVLGFYLL